MARPRKGLDLLSAFRAPRVRTLQQLGQRWQASRSTVLRRLHEHGYYSSYNHSGRFFTIEEVAEFDSRGLWTWKGASFSKHGNLKQTVGHFTEESEGGMTHQELATLLGVRVQNTLFELVAEERIHRQRLGPSFVYSHRKASRRREQVRRRREFAKEGEKPVPTSRQVIATLLELIGDPQVQRERIVLRCQHSGVSISREIVDTIFATCDLDKKRAP